MPSSRLHQCKGDNCNHFTASLFFMTSFLILYSFDSDLLVYNLMQNVNSEKIPKNKVIVSIPGSHSRKPPLGSIQIKIAC